MPSLSFTFVVFLLGYFHVQVLAVGIPKPFSQHVRRDALVTDFPDPNIDPFYRAPTNISQFSPGQVVRTRAFSSTVLGDEVESHQVFYRTTDAQGDAVGTVAVLLRPARPAHPPIIFSLQEAEDSLNLACSPSYAWANSSADLESAVQSRGVVVSFALSQGWYVVTADNEGPNSAYLVGPMEGHAALDSIRATMDRFHLDSRSTDIVLFGYSGGAHMTVWAASLAATYAPELKIIAAAHGGTPVDPHAAFEWLNGNYFAAQAGGALVGFANGYPKFNETLNSLLTPNGTKTVELIRSPACLLTHLAEFACLNFTTQFTSDPFLNPVISGLSAKGSLLSNVSTLTVPVPKFPRFEWHGTADKTLPYWAEAVYVQEQCAKGADIRFLTLPGLNHEPNEYSGTPGALQFIHQAVHKELGPVKCGANVSVPSIGSTEAVALLGATANAALAAFLEQAVEADKMTPTCT